MLKKYLKVSVTKEFFLIASLYCWKLYEFYKFKLLIREHIKFCYEFKNMLNVYIMISLQRLKNEWRINKLWPSCKTTLPLKMDHVGWCFAASNTLIVIKLTESQFHHNLFCTRKQQQNEKK